MLAKSLLLLTVAAGVLAGVSKRDAGTKTMLESKIKAQCENKGIDFPDFSKQLDTCTAEFLKPITSDFEKSSADNIDFNAFATTACSKRSELRACFEAIDTKLKTCAEDATKAYKLNLTTIDELINYACYNNGERIVSYVHSLLHCNMEEVDKDVAICSNDGLPMWIAFISDIEDRESVDEICTKADKKTTCMLNTFKDHCESSTLTDLFTPFFKIRRDAIGSPNTRCAN